MACLYKRKGSPYWWIEFRDSAGRRVQESTHCLVGNAPDARRAQKIRAQKEVEELTSAPDRKSGAWETWVPTFLSIRYNSNSRTLERYTESWNSLRMFLAENKIQTPSQLFRSHCFDYVNWRTQPNLMAGKYRAGRNTAILDLKILRIIMKEAVERQYVTGNPCVQLHIERAKPKIKPELTADQIALIRSKIDLTKDPEDREFFSNSFEIARYQGCRLSETYLNPMTDVNLQQNTITFQAKGGRTHTTLLHPNLVPLFQQLQSQGRTDTYHRPPDARRQWPSIRWTRFFRRHAIRGVCFHSLRVTAATAMARSKVPENLAKEFIGHASTTVHRGYLRLNSTDLGDCAKAIV